MVIDSVSGRWMTVALCVLALSRGVSADDFPHTSLDLETFRQAGDLRSERRHVWDVLGRLAASGSDLDHPLFESWYGEDAVFAAPGSRNTPSGMRGFGHAQDAHGSFTADIPLLTYTVYNAAAYAHIRRHRLYLRRELETLARAGKTDEGIGSDRSIPDFPPQAMVLKMAWWPVAARGSTVLPVWDADRNPPRSGGNDYTTWPRVVVIHPSAKTHVLAPATVDFAGNSFRDAHAVGAGDFYYIRIDKPLAARLSHDASARKVALLALGRPVEAGDVLVLVAANLATKEIRDWVWATIWWHDRPDESAFSADRPATVAGAWRHYLLQVAFDEAKPAAADGGPHICFNPWLEARFPDGGHGNGTVGNCLACHRRASYPAVNFLPVTRGAADLAGDPAFAPGRLRTGFLWSIAMHSRR